VVAHLDVRHAVASEVKFSEECQEDVSSFGVATELRSSVVER